MTMPKLNSSRVKHRIAALDLSSRKLAELTGIPWGPLRNALAGRDTASLNRAYKIARALDMPIGDVLASNEGVPDEPPPQPKPAPKPSRRQDREKTTGPKRATGTAA